MSVEEVYSQLQQTFVAMAASKRLFGLTEADASRAYGELFATTGVLSAILYAVAYVISLKETALESWKEAVSKTAESTRYGTWAWWIEAAKAFQLGDITEVIDGKVTYREIEPTHRIITAATVVQDGREIVIKVAKGENGNYSALSAEELQAFKGYIAEIKPLGLYVLAMSEPAAEVTIAGSVIYNSQLPQQQMRDKVVQALNDYFASLKFGGTIYRSQVADAIMGVDGVIDVAIANLVVAGNSVERSYQPIAGYAKGINSNDLTLEANYDTNR